MNTNQIILCSKIEETKGLKKFGPKHMHCLQHRNYVACVYIMSPFSTALGARPFERLRCDFNLLKLQVLFSSAL